MKKKSVAILFFSLINTVISNTILFIFSFIPINNFDLPITTTFFSVLSLIIFFNTENVKWLGKTVKNDSYHVEIGYALTIFTSIISLAVSIITWIEIILFQKTNMIN